MKTDNQKIRRSIVFGLGLSGMLGTNNSFGQDAFPNKAIRVVVPFPAGANVDVVARIFTDKLSKEINQSVVVENKPGAGGALGWDTVMQRPTDGYSLFMRSVLSCPSHHMCTPKII